MTKYTILFLLICQFTQAQQVNIVETALTDNILGNDEFAKTDSVWISKDSVFIYYTEQGVFKSDTAYINPVNRHKLLAENLTLQRRIKKLEVDNYRLLEATDDLFEVNSNMQSLIDILVPVVLILLLGILIPILFISPHN